MSATLDAEPIAAFLGDCPVAARRGPALRGRDRVRARPAATERAARAATWRAAVRRLVAERARRRRAGVPARRRRDPARARGAARRWRARADLDVLPLHGDLSPDEQDRAVAPRPRRKVILSTNVAETSVTIDGVVAVIDSGLARVAPHSPWSGLPTLQGAAISRASATQRAGRAGRTRPGRCLRLYTRHDHDTRPAHDAPEIARARSRRDRCSAARAAGRARSGGFGWFEAPPRGRARRRARAARSGSARSTQHGALTRARAADAALPAAPAAGAAARRGRGARRRPRRLRGRGAARRARARRAAAARPTGERAGSDLLADLDRFDEARARALRARSTARRSGLDLGATLAVERVRKQLERLAARAAPRRRGAEADERARPARSSPATPIAWRAAAQAERAASSCFGAAAPPQLAPTSVVRDAELWSRSTPRSAATQGARGAVTVRSRAARSRPTGCSSCSPSACATATSYAWNAAAGARRGGRSARATTARARRDARPPQADAGAGAARVLVARRCAPRARERSSTARRSIACSARVAFVRARCPELGAARARRRRARRARCARCARARRASPSCAARDRCSRRCCAPLDRRQRAQLDELAPERVTLPGGRARAGRTTRRGQPPWIASRLQDFFGMADGPDASRAAACR